MKTPTISFRTFAVIAVSLSVGAFALVTEAHHAWGNYHWARAANPFGLQLGDNVSSLWDGHLALASVDWSASSVLDTNVVAGGSNPKNCRPTSGRVEVCNNKYGNNGWLGVAQVWVSGDHITQGTVKLNDTYFSRAKYNTSAWRQFVMCQEVGHAFGLDHQDEAFDNLNLGTCMDYTNDPTTNQHPNAHDYEELSIIYGHLDAFASSLVSPARTSAMGGASDLDVSERAEWGKSVRASRDGHTALFARDLGRGQKVFTFVVWADE